MENKLYYTKSAAIWEEAIPLGNGNIGAMVYGGHDSELIRLNIGNLWSGSAGYNIIENKEETLKKIRQLIEEKKYSEASMLASREYCKNDCANFLPMGNTHLTRHCNHNPKEYYRSLDLQTAVSEVYMKEIYGTESWRKTYISYPHNIMVIDIINKTPYPDKKLFYSISASSELNSETSLENNCITVKGTASHPLLPKNENPLCFQYSIHAEISDGDIKIHNNTMVITALNRITLYIACETDFESWDKLPDRNKNLDEICLKRIQKAIDDGADKVYEEHIKDYSSLYNRVKLYLNGKENKLTTDERIKNYNGNDTGLVELLFNFGRYLMISASRTDSQAMNLQGLWNHRLLAPWRSNYTTNINTEMNYWCAESCNLSECHTPLFNMLKELSISGKYTAKQLYNCNGFAVHHNTDIWRKTDPAFGDSCYALWPMAGVWLCSHLWWHYEYTCDINFLKETAYPIIKSACEFLVDYLIFDGKYHITSPSTSPENVFVYNNQNASVGKMTTMDLALIKEIFENYKKTVNILNINNDEIYERIQKINLPPFKIGTDGRLLEWWEDFEETQKGYRHLSHLYGVFPGKVITEKDISLWQAAQNSLDCRLEHGSGYTGWSCGWILNLFAIFKKQEQVKVYIDNMFKNSIYPNLTDAHPPFQIDGNFGFTSGIANMLLQCEKEDDTYIIHILPALPKEYNKGSVSGLCAKGGFTVDIVWDNLNAKVKIDSKYKNKYKIVSDYKIEEI